MAKNRTKNSPAAAPRLTFLGAAQNVTGSRYLLEAGGSRILVDCGLYQERDLLARNWDPFPVPPASIDTLLLTHAHVDHCGYLPRLVHDGFHGRIVSTPVTAEIAAIILTDSAKIQVEDAVYKKKRHAREKRTGPHPEVPLYTMDDVAATLPLFDPVAYNTPVPIGDGLTAEFLDAGHILGSSSVLVGIGTGSARRTILFSGDVGRWDKPLLNDPVAATGADWIVVESTYGMNLKRKELERYKRMKENKSKSKKKKILNLIPIAVIIIVIVVIPFIFLNYQAKRSGLTMSESLKRAIGGSKSVSQSADISEAEKTGQRIDFLEHIPIGLVFTEPPMISHIQSVDLDVDGLLDVVVCDVRGNFVSWIRQSPKGNFTENILAEKIIAPSHCQVIDFDNDGDLDIMVGVLGMLFPNNDKIGSVLILENDGKYNFAKHVVVEKIARVSDVRAGDLNNDGLMDLVAAQFGYDDGETRWIENLGNWKFKSHMLQFLSGPINAELVDIDADGDLDIISLVSQEWEEIFCFINDGKGNFQPQLIWGSGNEDYGSSGIALCDLDKDGDKDILYTNGDAFDYIPPQGRPWHGVQWLENTGGIKFEYHRLCTFNGATNVRAADFDNDGDLDLVAVSAFNNWDVSESTSIILLQNDGKMNFNMVEIARKPTHLLCCDPGDFNNDGLMDVVTAGMHTFPPFKNMGRVTLWINNGVLK